MISSSAGYAAREVPAPTRDRGAAERIWVRLRDDRSGMIGLVVVGLFLAVAAAVWLGLAGQGWSAADGGRWEPAGPQHWFGTNVLGQDVFQRAIYSVRTAFEIGLAVALLSTALGAALGALIGALIVLLLAWMAGDIMATPDHVRRVTGLPVLGAIPLGKQR